MKLNKLAGATSEIWQIFIADSSSLVGAGKTGLLFNTAGLTAYYHRDTDTTATAIALATMTVGTFTSSGFKEIDATNMPGWYQFCPPNAALAAGAKSVALHLKGATNAADLPIEVQLTAVNPDDAVRAGMTALPNAAAEAAGGLYTRGAGAGQINQPGNGLIDVSLKAILNTALTETAGQIAAAFKQFFNIASPTSTMNVITTTTTTTNVTNDVGITQAAADKVWGTTVRAITDKAGFALSSAGIQAIFDFATSLLTTVGSIGKRLADDIDATISSRSTYAGGDTAGTATLLGRLTAGRATNLDNLDATVSSRSTLGGTAQTGDVYGLLTGAQAEPAAVPASNATPIVKIGYMFAKMRNKRLTTATADTLRNGGDTADIGSATLADDGTTFTKGTDT